jgi:Flp pilus assembly secretin CpaC
MKTLPLVAILMLLVGSTADAARSVVSLSVGQTKVISFGPAVEKVKLGDPSVLGVKRLPSGSLEVSGKALGKTPVQIRTSNGVEVELLIYVTSDGEVTIVGDASAVRVYR